MTMEQRLRDAAMSPGCLGPPEARRGPVPPCPTTPRLHPVVQAWVWRALLEDPGPWQWGPLPKGEAQSLP